jgi:hypothetical protein
MRSPDMYFLCVRMMPTYRQRPGGAFASPVPLTQEKRGKIACAGADKSPIFNPFIFISAIAYSCEK